MALTDSIVATLTLPILRIFLVATRFCVSFSLNRVVWIVSNVTSSIQANSNFAMQNSPSASPDGTSFITRLCEAMNSHFRTSSNTCPFTTLRPQKYSNLIRHQLLNINTLNPIKSQRVQHGLIMEPVKIYGFRSLCSGVLIFVPSRDAERVPLLPVEALAGDITMAGARDDVVD